MGVQIYVPRIALRVIDRAIQAHGAIGVSQVWAPICSGSGENRLRSARPRAGHPLGVHVREHAHAPHRRRCAAAPAARGVCRKRVANENVGLRAGPDEVHMKGVALLEIAKYTKRGAKL